jgi:hypothetical protein
MKRGVLPERDVRSRGTEVRLPLINQELPPAQSLKLIDRRVTTGLPYPHVPLGPHIRRKPK